MTTSTLNDLAGLIPDMALKERIQELVDAGYKKAQLAKAAGKTRAAVTHWLNGETLEIKADSAAGLQNLTGYNAIWIATGKRPKQISQNVTSESIICGSVSLLSIDQAGMHTEFIDNLHPGGNEYEQILTTVPINRHTFAVRVYGDSMQPKFNEGDILVVEPEMTPNPGDYVIAKNGSEEVTFKQLVKDGADWYLKPLNERYPIKPLGASTIVGVVRAVEMRLR